MTQLVKYDAACRAVAEAASIDEAKEFRDQSEAMRAYARQAKNKDMEAKAAEIRFRAERRIGELMSAQKDASALSKGGRPSEKTGSKTNPVSAPPSLEEVGIDKKLADRARKYAAIPEDEFNGIVDDWRGKIEAENSRVTVNLMAAGKKAETEQQAAATPAEEPDPHARLRREFRSLTAEAQEDDWIGLREALAEEKAKHRATSAKLKDARAALADLTADDKDEVIRRLQASVKHLNNQMFKANEDARIAIAARRRAEDRAKELEGMGIAL